MTRYQALAATTVGATLVLIVIGAVVRTTGSGLGCPDWPLCHGQLLPPAERTAVIEYTHRTAAAIVGVLILSTVIVALLRHREDRAVRYLAIAAVPLLGVQAWLGKETVERELPAEIVTVHLGMALLLLAVLSLIAAFAFLGPERRRIESRERASFVRLAAAVAAIVLVVLLGGSYVVGANATTACTTWPGCDQAPVPFLDGLRAQHIQWAHRLSTIVGFGVVGLLALNATDLKGTLAAPLRTASMALLALYAGQVLLGAANIWTDFSQGALAAHLAGGAAIWGLAVLILVTASYQPGPRPHEARAPQSAGEREPARV
jgi:heme A synthase